MSFHSPLFFGLNTSTGLWSYYLMEAPQGIILKIISNIRFFFYYKDQELCKLSINGKWLQFTSMTCKKGESICNAFLVWFDTNGNNDPSVKYQGRLFDVFTMLFVVSVSSVTVWDLTISLGSLIDFTALTLSSVMFSTSSFLWRLVPFIELEKILRNNKIPLKLHIITKTTLLLRFRLICLEQKFVMRG